MNETFFLKQMCTFLNKITSLLFDFARPIVGVRISWMYPQNRSKSPTSEKKKKECPAYDTNLYLRVGH